MTFNAFSFMRDGSDSTKYNREDYTGSSAWIDADKDCQNTRAEVLIEESINDVKFRKYKPKDTTLTQAARDSLIAKKSRDCVVDSGLWHDPYTGTIFKKANDLDIDHMVALEDAHRSGALSWTKEEKKAYSNYLKDKGHLIAVSKSENRKKGSKGPEEYLPPNNQFKEEYCRIYVRIKVRFGLTSNSKQLLFLQNMFMEDTSIILPKLRP